MKSSYHIFFISLLSITIALLASCQRESPCETLDCGQYGHCTIDSNGDPICDCDDGYVGTPCQPIDLCPPGVCENGGTCLIDDFGNVYCDCPEGFIGENCEEIDPCQAQCTGNTTCNVLPNNTFECVCLDGYEDGAEPCDTEMREKFIGTYDMFIACTNGFTLFEGNCIISKDTDNVRRVIFDNFGNFGTEIYGLVIESNTLVIPLQYTNSGVLIRGIEEASLSDDNAITIRYKYETEEDGEVDCEFVLFQ